MQPMVLMGPPGSAVRFYDGTRVYLVGCEGGNVHQLHHLSLRSNDDKCRLCTAQECELISETIVSLKHPSRDERAIYRLSRMKQDTWWQMEVYSVSPHEQSALAEALETCRSQGAAVA